ncbi:MAG: RNA-guided pseudouridylation complex pseudouridine synthase subunit Cbf5 [Promethearchaeota archaeon]
MVKMLPADKKWNLVVKGEEETDPGYGVYPKLRTLYDKLNKGIINVDKVAGPTSHEVVSWVKKIFSNTNVVKTGHGGTLDPKVTGVLPTALNVATRCVDILLTAGKEYVCIMTLHGEENASKIQTAFEFLKGKIYQRPPVRSAVKRKLRIREVYYIDILEIDGNKVLFKIGCQAGTYIRKICYDIGEILGCGAHMSELRRTRSGPFKEDESLVTLQDLADAVYYWKEEENETQLSSIIQPMEIAFMHLPKIVMRDSAVDPICHGANLTAPGVLKLSENIKKDDLVALFTLKNEIVAIGKSLKSAREIIENTSGFVVNVDRVFMERGTYPKWIKK